MLLALAHLCWLQLPPGSELRRISALATRSAASPAAVSEYERLDRIAKRTGRGNLLLKLDRDTKQNAAVEASLSFVYYRMGYALYPRRIYVAPADAVINDGWDILRIDFSPGREWLQEHAVGSVLTFGSDDAGREMLRLQILKPRHDQAGIPADESGGN